MGIGNWGFGIGPIPMIHIDNIMKKQNILHKPIKKEYILKIIDILLFDNRNKNYFNYIVGGKKSNIYLYKLLD